jgi:hypothetical protein
MGATIEPSVHIYTLSRLVNARVGSWQKEDRGNRKRPGESICVLPAHA